MEPPPSQGDRRREYLSRLEHLWHSYSQHPEKLRAFMDRWSACGWPALPPSFYQDFEQSVLWLHRSTDESLRRVLFLWAKHEECRPTVLSGDDLRKLHTQLVYTMKGEHQLLAEQKETVFLLDCLDFIDQYRRLRPVLAHIIRKDSELYTELSTLELKGELLKKKAADVLDAFLAPLPLSGHPLTTLQLQCQNLLQEAYSLQREIVISSAVSAEARMLCQQLLQSAHNINQVLSRIALVYVVLSAPLSQVTALYDADVQTPLQQELSSPSLCVLQPPWEGSTCILGSVSVHDLQKMRVPEVLLHSLVKEFRCMSVVDIPIPALASVREPQAIQLVGEIRKGKEMLPILYYSATSPLVESGSWILRLADKLSIQDLIRANVIRPPAKVLVGIGGRKLRALLNDEGRMSCHGTVFDTLEALVSTITGHQLVQGIVWDAAVIRGRSLQAYKSDFIRKQVAKKLLEYDLFIRPRLTLHRVRNVWAVQPVSESAIHRYDVLVKTSQPIEAALKSHPILQDPLVTLKCEEAPIDLGVVNIGEGLRPVEELADVGTLGCFCVLGDQHVAITAYHVLAGCKIPISPSNKSYRLHTHMSFSILRVSSETDSALLIVKSGIPACHFPYLDYEAPCEASDDGGSNDCESDESNEKEGEDDENENDDDEDGNESDEYEGESENDGEEDEQRHGGAKEPRLNFHIPWDRFATDIDLKNSQCVFKQGCSTGLTHGHLSSVKTSINARSGEPIHDVVVISSTSKPCFFAEPGDSGSLCWAQRGTQRIPIGILIRGPPRAQLMQQESAQHYVVRLDVIVQALGKAGEIFSFCGPHCGL